MPAIGPIKRRELIAYLRALGFEPPVSGGEHQYMKGRGRKLRIPNPHARILVAACWCGFFAKAGLIARNGKRSEVALPGCAVLRGCGSQADFERQGKTDHYATGGIGFFASLSWRSLRESSP